MSLKLRMRKARARKAGPLHEKWINHEEREDPTATRRFGQRGMIGKPQVAAKPQNGKWSTHQCPVITSATSSTWLESCVAT